MTNIIAPGVPSGQSPDRFPGENGHVTFPSIPAPKGEVAIGVHSIVDDEIEIESPEIREAARLLAKYESERLDPSNPTLPSFDPDKKVKPNLWLSGSSAAASMQGMLDAILRLSRELIEHSANEGTTLTEAGIEVADKIAEKMHEKSTLQKVMHAVSIASTAVSIVGAGISLGFACKGFLQARGIRRDIPRSYEAKILDAKFVNKADAEMYANKLNDGLAVPGGAPGAAPAPGFKVVARGAVQDFVDKAKAIFGVIEQKVRLTVAQATDAFNAATADLRAALATKLGTEKDLKTANDGKTAAADTVLEKERVFQKTEEDIQAKKDQVLSLREVSQKTQGDLIKLDEKAAVKGAILTREELKLQSELRSQVASLQGDVNRESKALDQLQVRGKTAETGLQTAKDGLKAAETRVSVAEAADAAADQGFIRAEAKLREAHEECVIAARDAPPPIPVGGKPELREIKGALCAEGGYAVVDSQGKVVNISIATGSKVTETVNQRSSRRGVTAENEDVQEQQKLYDFLVDRAKIIDRSAGAKEKYNNSIAGTVKGLSQATGTIMTGSERVHNVRKEVKLDVEQLLLQEKLRGTQERAQEAASNVSRWIKTMQECMERNTQFQTDINQSHRRG